MARNSGAGPRVWCHPEGGECDVILGQTEKKGGVEEREGERKRKLPAISFLVSLKVKQTFEKRKHDKKPGTGRLPGNGRDLRSSEEGFNS